VSEDCPDQDAVATCDHCGFKGPCVFLPSPYLADVYPEDENPPSWWCESCLENNLDDI